MSEDSSQSIVKSVKGRARHFKSPKAKSLEYALVANKNLTKKTDIYLNFLYYTKLFNIQKR